MNPISILGIKFSKFEIDQMQLRELAVPSYFDYNFARFIVLYSDTSKPHVYADIERGLPKISFITVLTNSHVFYQEYC
jgi:hypothetical protein